MCYWVVGAHLANLSKFKFYPLKRCHFQIEKITSKLRIPSSFFIHIFVIFFENFKF
jgi:hypothetical protein